MNVAVPLYRNSFNLKPCKCSRVCLLLQLIRAEREVPCSALCSSQETTYTAGALRISWYPKFNKFPNQTMWQEPRLFGVLMEWEVRTIYGESFRKLVCWHFTVGRYVYSTVLRFSGFVNFWQLRRRWWRIMQNLKVCSHVTLLARVHYYHHY